MNRPSEDVCPDCSGFERCDYHEGLRHGRQEIKSQLHTAALDFVNQEIRSRVKGHLDELKMIHEQIRGGDAEEIASACNSLMAEIHRLEEQEEIWKRQAEELDKRLEDEMGKMSTTEGDNTE